ncbi:MAG: polysaccharide biosynthesis tyrosine autokinase [Lysobacteraceae bacterium]|nr:MAG: polysaccharide biosynthesis tyrosine autokinase [Xanthomonadaceae bacterium]
MSAVPISQTTEAAPADDEINLLEYWQILRERQWLVAGIAAAVFLLALVFTLLATPIFRASSTLQIERDSMKIVDVGALTPAESPMDRDFYQTQYELLQSRSLALRVVQDLKLVEHPQFAETMESVDEALAGKGAGAPASGPLAREQALVQPLLNGLSIEPVRNSRLVRVNFDSPDPVLAARVANAYGDAFIASNLERRFEASSYARKYLEDRLAELKAKLEDTEKELVGFATSEQIVSVGDDQPSLSAQNLSQLNASLAAAQDARIRSEAAWRQASAGNGLGLPQVVSSALIQKLRESRSLLAAEYQQKLRTFKPDYPDMQRLSGQIAETDRQIAGEIGNIRAAVKSEYDAARQQESLLESRLSGLKGDVLDLQGRSIQYNILKRDAETNRQLYDGLLQRYKEISVVGNVGTNNISVIDRAEVPNRRHSPRLSLNLAVGLLLGLFAGVLAAFLRHHLDRSIHSAKALEALAHAPVLGVIPRLDAGTTPAMAAADLRSPFAESYRSVRTALQFATSHGLPYSLLVTSPGPGEGKSTTALELARNIAQLGKRVVLVDADLRNPSLHRLNNLSNQAGLSNVLAGAAGADDVLQPGSEPSLSLITSGPLPPNPPELLAGERLGQLLESLRGRFDMVVLDGPPVLGLADAPLLAHGVEATLLVAAADKTRSDSLQGARQRLVAAHARIIGTLLTQFDLRRKGESYGYGGYSYYSYGGDADRK